MIQELPYVLRPENICHLESDSLYIGDRRVFPFERRFERCETVEQVASALRQMVTQGGGPLQVALTMLRFVARLMEQGKLPFSFQEMERSANLLIEARPTNTTMKRTLQQLLLQLQTVFAQKTSLVEEVEKLVGAVEQHYDQIYHTMGMMGASLLEDGDTVLTTCFAEHTFLLSLAYAKKEGKHISVLVSETRPYLQGAHLTAPSLKEMGIDAKLITDGMGAHYLFEKRVNMYMTASDVVCMDGTVVNKTGTLANAIACNYFHVPYYAFCISPDTTKDGLKDLKMEERDGGEVKKCMGHPTTSEDIEALYPSFDIVPSSLVQGIVTPKGVLAPQHIKRSFS